MPAKKATTGAAKPKAAAAPVHGSYRDMIRDAIIALKERNGSSRSTLKKYVQANNKGVEPGASFDNMFNKAIKSGVEKGEFSQPKGPSGTVKLAKKDAAPAKPAAASKKPAAAKKAKAAAPKKEAAAPKKSAPKAKTATKAKPGPKKGSTNTKKPAAVGRPKANTSKARKSKTPAAAPAIIDEKKVLGKTKSGRVTKGPAKPTNPAKKTASAPSKKKAATPAKKAATPKKTATPAAPAA